MENTGVKVSYEGQMLESNILLVEGPPLINCRALASETNNESSDHHDATDHRLGSVSATMKASALYSDAGGGQVSGAERQVYKVASSGPSGKGAGH
ncbi:hypothetical protein SADUNF_Sadunf05G0106100 [Salix dunnii]|uniref:Uncharacterized protein n=1 Tax=Salix dunnii TaxID=1413687 RepID=A0A835K3I0_9ROSI|nr:hypothetical protein SADUNF_Sadunf05G0106100 [Salix dunnii]